MTLNPVEIKLINTRQDTIDFIYFLYSIYAKTDNCVEYDYCNNMKSIYNKYVFYSIIPSSDSINLDTYYDGRYIEITFNDKCKTIELDIQIDDKYKLNDTKSHSYTCTITDFLNTKDTGVETNTVSMVLNVLYDNRKFINKAIQEGFDTRKSLINIIRAIKE